MNSVNTTVKNKILDNGFMRSPGHTSGWPGGKVVWLLTFLICGCLLVNAEAATVVVNATSDAGDASPGDNICDTGGLNSAGTAECTLRAAIEEANVSVLVDTISFNIPPTESGYSAVPLSYTIQAGVALPAFSEQVVIDGSTQPDFPGSPIIIVDGASAGVAANGLVIGATGGNSTIRGLVVQGFSENGILLLGGSNTIAGNHLGIGADGMTIGGNNTSNLEHQGGIRVESSSNLIGGVTSADRNVISGNFFAGIELFGASATGNQVYGNYVGLDVTGTLGRGNTQEGIDLELSDSNIIGGPAAGQRNILSGNGSDGIEIDGGDGNIVQGNYTGTDVTGTLIIANGRDGVDINENGVDGATNSLIGGTGPGEGNLIRGNSIYGVQVRGAPVTDNAIVGNRIYGNTALGIDLNDDGVTANDALDVDAGPNDLLNYPVINSAVEFGGSITVDFEANLPAGNYRIEFFSNPSGADSSNYGEGQVFVSAMTITHNGSGDQPFVHAFPGSVGDVMTATATEEFVGPIYRSTSEFSRRLIVTPLVPFSARWPLDETSGVTAADVDAGNDGTYQNGVLLNQPAACTDTGNGVYFDGIDDFIEVPHSSDYMLSQGSVTLWANVDALGTAQGLFSKDSTTFDTGGHLTISVNPGGDVETRLQSATASMYVNSTPIIAGNWFHVAFSWGPAGMALYVDGAAPVTNPYTGGLSKTSGGVGNFEPIALGAVTIISDDLLVTPTTEFLAGFMDDVRIYNRALTPAEIQTLANCTPATPLNIVKRTFWPDGTPIPSGATIPSGLEFKFLLYINNPAGTRSDVSVQDILGPAFQYQSGTIQMDNSVTECAAASCTAAEEQSIFTAVNGVPFATDAVDGDGASYTGGSTTIDAGDSNAANAQLDIASDTVWAVLFSAKMP